MINKVFYAKNTSNGVIHQLKGAPYDWNSLTNYSIVNESEYEEQHKRFNKRTRENQMA